MHTAAALTLKHINASQYEVHEPRVVSAETWLVGYLLNYTVGKRRGWTFESATPLYPDGCGYHRTPGDALAEVERERAAA